MPHPSTITTLCIMGKVKFDMEEEERCTKTSPLTLTVIVKPSSNKGKEKVREIEAEERKVKNHEQSIVVSTMKRRE